LLAKYLTIVFDEKNVPSAVSRSGKVLNGEIELRSALVSWATYSTLTPKALATALIFLNLLFAAPSVL
jgi:hypothetical protein